MPKNFIFLFISFLSLSSFSYAFDLRHGNALGLMPDGNFVSCGGWVCSGASPNECATYNQTNTCQIYSTTVSAYGEIAPLNVSRSSHTLTVLSNGKLMVAGGYNASGAVLQSVEIYDPVSKTWTNKGDILSSPRGGHTANLIAKGAYAGDVLICGGQTATGISNNCDILSPDGDLVKTIDMISPRFAHASAVLPSGKIFISGGLNNLDTSLDTSYIAFQEIFDPVISTFTSAQSLMEARAFHNITTLNNGNVLIIGGYNHKNQRDRYSKDKRGPEYMEGDDDVQTRQGQGSWGYLESFEMYDQNGARVTVNTLDYGTLPYRVSKSASILKNDGSVEVVGGYGNIPVSYISPPNLIIASGSWIKVDSTGKITDGDIYLISQEDLPTSRNDSIGRIVDSDLFLAPYDPEYIEPSFTLENAEFYIGESTVSLDSHNIGCLRPYDCGWLLVKNAQLQLGPPGSISKTLVKWIPIDVKSVGGITVNSGKYTFSGPLSSGETKTLINDSTISFNATFYVPEMYIGYRIYGTLYLGEIAIADNLSQYNVSIKNPPGINLPGITVLPGSLDGQPIGLLPITVDPLDISGQTIQSSTEGVLNSPLDASNDYSLSELTSKIINFTSDGMALTETGNNPIFSVGQSTIVVRQMVMRNEYEFSPIDSKFIFKGPIADPVFDTSGILTPAGDMMFSSGLNCEYPDGSLCVRTNPTFYPYSSKHVSLDVFTGKWPEGPKLNQKRAKHTSTVLPDGSVLVCGGTDGTKALQSCELLDSKTGKFVYTSSMTIARVNHTATLLSNGNVLITGGTLNDSQYSVVLSSAEIYYPDTKRFVPTSPMNTGRTLHTATLLADGNVLVIGGATNGGYSAFGEVYISSSATWEYTASNPGANNRQEHTATFMRNNTVLISGGINGSGVLSSVYVYNPINRTFAATASMSTPRKGHTANLLKDGRVLVVGGSNGSQVLDTVEWYRYETGNWTTPTNEEGYPIRMVRPRSNHKTILLPNGKALITGGENPGLRTGLAEIYNIDFSTLSMYGLMPVRQFHTSVILSSGNVINIGGYDGQKYLDSSDSKYFSAIPDEKGAETALRRRPIISTATAYLYRGENLTLMSSATNFHSLTEAAAGTGGGKSASHSNPRIYLSAVDNPSSFLIDLTTSIYSGLNSNWEKTQSSMTIAMPSNPGELPYGWYYLYAVSNAQFSEGFLIQITTPRPKGYVTVPSGVVLSSHSVQWTWNIGTLTGAEGYAIFASSNNVFISTKALDNPATFIHANLQANTPSSIKVTGYNFGGYGSPLIQSPTYYTYANPPANLTVAKSGFNSIELEWSPNGNSNTTPYEVSLAEEDPTFNTGISTPVPFANNHLSTSTVISSLTPNKKYYFRVRAMNGDGFVTAFSPTVSTITVSLINNLGGTPLSVSEIYWSWDSAPGADGYQIYDVTYGTTTAVSLGTTTTNNYIQSGLSTNTVSAVQVRAYKVVGLDTVYGPFSVSTGVFTLSAPPLPGVPNSYINVTTGSFTVNWISNGNPPYTSYDAVFSTSAVFSSSVTFNVKGTSFTLTGLKPNFLYYSKVCSVNEDGVRSACVNLGGKYTLARPPASVKPESVSLSGVTLAWDALDNSTMTVYQIRVSTDINMTPYTIPYGAAFSDNLVDNRFNVSGLWTNTTYYMDVTARNMEGILTASVRATPNPTTLSGPQGAPPMSIGGTSDPTKDVTIKGYLPPDPIINASRSVTLIVPAQSFETPTAIAISSSTDNFCNWLVEGTHPISFKIYADAQPKDPVTLKFDYTYNEAYSGINGVDSNRTRIVLARYNPLTSQCIPLETTVDQGTREITAKLNHFSHFQLMLYSPATNLNNVKVFPNPFYPNKGQGYVTITGMPANAKISIYSLSGDLLYETTSNSSGNAYWEGKNKRGFYVGSGVYLCVIKSSVGKKVLKIAVER